VFAVEPEGDETVRDVLGDVAVLSRSVGFRVPEAGLTCVVGAGARRFDRLSRTLAQPSCRSSENLSGRNTRRSALLAAGMRLPDRGPHRAFP
jgi:hypothetical protein